MNSIKAASSCTLLFILLSFHTLAQSVGDYQSTSSGNWNDLSVWQTYTSGGISIPATHTPTSADGHIYILNNDSITITQNLTADQIAIIKGSSVTINSGVTLTVAKGTDLDLYCMGTLNLNGSLASAAGTETITIDGTINWNSGSISSHSIIFSTNGILNISGTGTKTLQLGGGILESQGIINWYDSGPIWGNNSTIYVMAGGVFNCFNDAEIQYSGTGTKSMILNYGTLRKLFSSGTTNLNNTSLFNAGGTVDLRSGNLSLSYNGAYYGSFSIADSANLNFVSGQHSFYNGTSFTGGGTVQFSAPYILLTGTNPTGSVTDQNFNLPSGILFKAGKFSLLGTPGVSVSVHTLNFSTGIISGSGNFILSGNMNWTSTGQFNSLSSFSISSGGILNILGSESKIMISTNINNSGIINWIGSCGIQAASSVIQNNAAGVINIQSDGGFYDYGSQNVNNIYNSGLVEKTAGTGTSTLGSVNFTNTGSLIVKTGTLSIPLSLTNFASNTLTNGTYNIKGIFKFKDASIAKSNAVIILDSTASQILNSADNTDALLNFAENGASGNLTLQNGRDLILSIPAFTNNGILDCGNNIISGSCRFTNSTGACLITGSVNGINLTGSIGSIQTSGTRTFSAGANYQYNGILSQNSGDGLPANVNNFTINNPQGLTLASDLTVGGTLLMTSGVINTGINTLTLGTGVSSLGILSGTSGYINGKFKRWLSNSAGPFISFPLATSLNCRSANVTFTSAPDAGGTITAFFTASDPGSTGLPLLDGISVTKTSPDGYWTLLAGDGLSGGLYNLDLNANGFNGVTDYTCLHLLKRTEAQSSWSVLGIHSTCTGNNSSPVVHRTGLSGFSEFCIGSSEENPLSVELASFTSSVAGRNVKLIWKTVSEINTNGFEIERMQNSTWEKIGFVQGHGSINSPMEYSYEDRGVNACTNCYRLKVSDNNGRYQYSDLLKVNIKQVPDGFVLNQNYPNPFNPSTVISYQLPVDGNVSIKVYDNLGKEILTLVNEYKPAGYYETEFNALMYPSGIYMYRLSSNGFISTRKMVFFK